MRPVVTELADGVFHVERPGTKWQLLVEGDAVTPADAAWPRDLRLVARSLGTIGRRLEDVVVILLTHADRDHLGTDDHSIQPVENITALVQTAIVTRWGEGFTKLTDAPFGQLTTAGLRDLSARVAGGAECDAVAARRLHAEGLA